MCFERIKVMPQKNIHIFVSGWESQEPEYRECIVDCLCVPKHCLQEEEEGREAKNKSQDKSLK